VPADEVVHAGPPSWPNRENTTEFEAVSMEDVESGVEPESEHAAVQHGAEEARADDDIPWSGRDFAWG
jgi:hypothetical protein